MKIFIFFFCLASALLLPPAEANEPKAKNVSRTISLRWEGARFAKAPTIDININGVNLRYPKLEELGGRPYHLGIPFIQPFNELTIRAHSDAPDDFIIKQGGREVCRLKLKAQVPAECNFEASDKPTFILEDTIQELKGTFKTLSTETAFELAKKHFSGPHHMTVKTGVFRSKIEDGKRTYKADGLKSARFSDLAHFPHSMAIDPSSEDAVFMLFRPGDIDLEPLVKGTDIFGFTLSDDVFGVTIMRVSGTDYIVAELSRRNVKSVLAF